MRYIIKHKDHDVCTILYDLEHHSIEKIVEIHDPKRMPIFLDSKDAFYRIHLKDWFASRSIPSTRQYVNNDLKRLDIARVCC